MGVPWEAGEQHPFFRQGGDIPGQQQEPENLPDQQYRCGDCGHAFMVPASQFSATVSCPKCGSINCFQSAI